MADERVATAFRNWGPRFVVRGVDYGDVVRLTGSIGRWEDWPGAWTEVAEEHAALARAWEAAGHCRSAGQAWNRAALCHHFGRFLSVGDPAAYRAGSERAVAALRQAHRMLDPTAERIEVDLGGARMVAILRRPGGSGRPPLVLLIPGLDSTKEEFLLWEDVYLERGLATLSLDGPGQGEGGDGAGRMRPDYETAVAAVLDRLAGRDDVDLARVGAIGVSLGGYYAPRAASGEPRLRAVVALAGPYELTEFWEQAPDVTRDKLLFHLGVDHPEARERLAAFSLAGRAQTIRQPLLVVAGRRDRLVPPAHAERLAAEAPNARLVVYEAGNHGCTNLHWRHTPMEADWLAEQLR
ncbi:MAG TPA: alpha/beta fold hydrolase [Candidatus Dormibacteraeota bacterium]